MKLRNEQAEEGSVMRFAGFLLGLIFEPEHASDEFL
jgi:hypothetical protein